MNRLLSHLGLSVVTAVGLSSCGGGDYDDSASGGDPGGGNVGFGGAQDIGQFRNILDEGDIPGPQTLDANGFFSEHHAELPAPDCGQTLCVHGLLSVGRDWIAREQRTTLQIAINTPQDPSELVRAPLNLVVVLDTSGSMAEDDRLAYAKLGLHRLVDALLPGDRLALVTYSTGVRVWNDLSVDPDRAALHDVISRLEPLGSTNIHDGLRDGFQIVTAAFDLERQNRVILVSDGLATAGITADEPIIAMAEGFISDGIGLTTIGVGLDFNVELMRGLAERGAGNFYFLDDAAAIEEVFGEEIDFFVSPLALDITLEVAADGAYDLGDVVGTRLWQTAGTEGSVYIPAAFLASRTGEDPGPNGRRGGGSALFIQMIPRATFVDPYKVAQVRLRYRLPGSEQVLEQTVVVTNPTTPTESPDGDEYLSQDLLAHHHAMYNTFLGLRGAAASAQTDYSCALSILTTLDAEARAWNARHGDVDIAADLALIGQFRTNLIARGAEAGGACDDSPDPYQDPWGTPYGDDYDDDYYYGCSVGGSPGSSALLWLGLAIALAGVTRHRRSRTNCRRSPR